MKEHLLGSHLGIRVCPNAPEEVRTEMKNYLEMKGSAKKKKQEEFDERVDSGSYFGGSSNASASVSGNVDKRRVRRPMDIFVARDGGENAQATQPTQQVMPHNAKEARRLVCPILEDSSSTMDFSLILWNHRRSWQCVDPFANMLNIEDSFKASVEYLDS